MPPRARPLPALLAGVWLVLAAIGPVAAQAPSAETAATAAPSPITEVSPDAQPARVIELVTGTALRFLRDGEPATDIAVRPGETILFRIHNTAMFGHNFYIGTEEDLAAAGSTTGVGIPTWSRGVMELEWTVPDDITGLKFGCTAPGHYVLMQGTFSVAESLTPSPTSEAEALPSASPDVGVTP